MSVTDVTSRISQIQAQLALLAPAGATGATGAADFSARAQAHDQHQPRVRRGAVDRRRRRRRRGRKYLGVPYVWGGTDPAKGLDCSGLVQHVYKNLGYDLPRVSYQQAARRPAGREPRRRPSPAT